MSLYHTCNSVLSHFAVIALLHFVFLSRYSIQIIYTMIDITKTYLYNFDPLKPHFYTMSPACIISEKVSVSSWGSYKYCAQVYVLLNVIWCRLQDDDE